MNVLAVHETPILSGDAFDLVTQILDAYDARCEFASIASKGTKCTVATWKARHAEIVAQAHDFDRVLPMGNVATSAIFDTDKAVLISKVRGRGYICPAGNYCVPTWAPIKVTNGGWDGALMYRDLVRDIDKLVTQQRPLEPPSLDVEIVTSRRQLRDALDVLDAASVIGCDTEGTGLSSFRDRTRELGMCALRNDDSGYCVIVPEHMLYTLRDDLHDFMTSYAGAFVFHNIKYDSKMLAKLFGRTFRFRDPWDTMLMHYAQDERPSAGGVHSLETLARCRYDAEYKTDPLALYEAIDGDDAAASARARDELYEYLARDCYYTTRLFFDLRDELRDEDPKLLDLVRDILVPGAVALGETEDRGIRLDIRRLRDLKTSIVTQLADDLAELQRFVYEKTGREEFNPNSPKQVEHVLYDDLGLEVPRNVGRVAYRTTDLSKRPTGKDVLRVLSQRIAKERPVVAALLDDLLSYRQRSKIIGTYIDGMIERCDTDGRIRGNFSTHGSATGRLSCSNPNLQNIPEPSHINVDLREAFIPSEGFELVEADYSQLELRVAALFSRDEALLNAYRNDLDLHQDVAFRLFKKPKEEITKRERYLAKCLTFGIAYGRGAASIATGPEMMTMQKNEGKSWSMKEVRTYHKAFFDTFRAYAAWQEQQKSLARTQRFVQTPTGRKRRFTFIAREDNGHTERMAVNTPIQSFASDLCFTAMTRIHERIRREMPGDAFVLFTIHDSILLEVRRSRRDDLARIIVEEMEQNLPPYIDYVIPLKCEISVGKNGREPWGSLKETL